MSEQDWWDGLEKLDKKLEAGEILTGEDAAMFLAGCFENETHGNYEDGILFSRANVEGRFEITVKKKEKKDAK